MAIPLREAFDIFNDVRGMITFYLFIMEEAVQTGAMAAYLARKEGNIELSKTYASWVDENLITTAINFNTTVGIVAYPMNEAFKSFYDAARQSIQYYQNDPVPVDE